MTDKDVRIMMDYAEENFYDLNKNVSKDTFKCMSYANWAVDEILKRMIRQNERVPYYISGVETLTPIEVVEDFIDEMDYFESMSTSADAILMFSIAKEEGENVLHIFTKGADCEDYEFC